MKYNFFIILLFVFVACNKPIVNIYEWRGPGRTGVYNESGLLRAWNDSGPDLLFEINEIGLGYGSPVVTSDNLYLIGTIDSTSYLFSFSLTGELQYKTEIGAEWVVNFPGSRSTPTVVDEHIYTETGNGILSCIERFSGKIVWQKNLITDFGGVSPVFGFSESPAVYGDLVFCSPGNNVNNVVALNRLNGDLVWSCEGKGERSAYNSPLVFNCGSRKILATFSAYHLLGIDIETGKLLWAHEQINTPVDKREPGTGDTHANTVLVDGNTLYYVEGDGNCAVALQLSNDGSSISQLWNNAAVDNYMGGIVKCDQFIYCCAFSENNLVKIDVKNGSVIESLPLNKGSVIAADNLLFYYNFRGEVNLVDIQSGRFNLVSSFKEKKGSKEHFAHPVINNGILYIRHGDFLGAYKIAAN